MDEAYLEKRKAVEAFFIPENQIENSCESLDSPCGRYRLVTNRYATGPKSWAYSRGVVTRLSDGKQLVDVKRNIGHFWHLFTIHPNGSTYFLCGEDYQGYSVYNLSSGTESAHFPTAGHDGFGFCWTVVHPSPDGLMLAVDGCYWAAPYEIVFYDFRKPDELPFAEFARIDNLEKVVGWKGNSTFVLTREVHYRISDGQPYEDLSDAEQDAIDSDDKLGAYRSDVVEFSRPPVTGA